MDKRLVNALEDAEKALCIAYLACGQDTREIQELVNQADRLVEQAQKRLER